MIEKEEKEERERDAKHVSRGKHLTNANTHLPQSLHPGQLACFHCDGAAACECQG